LYLVSFRARVRARVRVRARARVRVRVVPPPEVIRQVCVRNDNVG